MIEQRDSGDNRLYEALVGLYIGDEQALLEETPIEDPFLLRDFKSRALLRAEDFWKDRLQQAHLTLYQREIGEARLKLIVYKLGELTNETPVRLE